MQNSPCSLSGPIKTTARIRAREWKCVINHKGVSNLRPSAISLHYVHSYIQPDLQVEPSPLAELWSTPDHKLALYTKGELSGDSDHFRKIHTKKSACSAPDKHINPDLKHLIFPTSVIHSNHSPSHYFTAQEELLHHQVQAKAG